MNKHKVVIVEDNLDVSEGFRTLINSTDNFEVTHTFDDAESALKNLDNISPDIILMDIDLPGINGIEATNRIKQKFPKVNIIIITVFENSYRVYEALCVGATGYLTKNTNSAQLLYALDEVIEGGAPMSANIARMVANSFRRNTNSPLTEKETSVLLKLSEGKSYKSTADLLFVSLATVKFHIKNIYLKLQVCTKEDAITLARKERYI
jgi:DNA-binding NarL/FixJ family response regulator